MRLILYPTSAIRPVVRPAPTTRPWMDSSPQAFAYRCLPLNIANGHGWEILCPTPFAARWNGGPLPGDVEIQAEGPGGWPGLAHFGCGVVTFHIGYLIRTEPRFDLWVGGPTNSPKDGITALTGVVETDWAPYTFTMNWVLTRPGHWVRFERDEPFCSFFPLERGVLEQTVPEIHDMADAPETKVAFDSWSANRGEFLKALPVAGSEANRQRWQKDYYRGLDADGQRVADDHRTKMQLTPPVDRTVR